MILLLKQLETAGVKLGLNDKGPAYLPVPSKEAVTPAIGAHHPGHKMSWWLPGGPPPSRAPNSCLA